MDANRKKISPGMVQVHEVEPRIKDRAQAIDLRDRSSAPLARLGMDAIVAKTSKGDDIDIRCAVEERVEVRAGRC